MQFDLLTVFVFHNGGLAEKKTTSVWGELDAKD